MLEAGTIALSQVRGLPRNPKDHDLGAIHIAIDELSFLERVLVNRATGTLIAGHGRVQVLRQKKAMGETPPANIQAADGEWWVPCDYCQIPAEKEEAAAIALNRTVQLGGWNDGVLAQVLSDIAVSDKHLLQVTGYDSDDLDALLRRLGEDAKEQPPVRMDVYPLAIVLSRGDHQRWEAYKVSVGIRDDTAALVRLLPETG